MKVPLAVPADVAFDWFSDPSHRPLWQSSLRRVEQVEGEPRLGQTWTDVTKPGLRPAMRTTRFERPRLWAEEGVWRGVRADLTMRFVPAGDGCTAEVTFRITGRGPLAVAGAVLSRLAAPAVRADVRRAARLLAQTA